MNNLSTVFFSFREFAFDLYCESRELRPRHNKACCLEIDIPMTEDEVAEYGLWTTQSIQYYILYISEYE